MKKILLPICSLFLVTVAFAAAPSPESIERLLAVTKAEKLVNSLVDQVDGMMKSSMDSAMRASGRPVTQEATQFAEAFRKKMVVMMKDEMSWDKMKGLYVQVYSESFNQEEIDGLISFYESKAGQAFVAKMPVVAQKTLTLTQLKMRPMMEKMQVSVREAMEEVRSMQEKKAENPELPAVAPVKTQ